MVGGQFMASSGNEFEIRFLVMWLWGGLLSLFPLPVVLGIT